MIEMQMTEAFIDIHKAYLPIIIKSENKVYRPPWARGSQGEPPSASCIQPGLPEGQVPQYDKYR